MSLILVGISNKTELEQSSLFCSINSSLSLRDVIPPDYKDLATSLSVCVSILTPVPHQPLCKFEIISPRSCLLFPTGLFGFRHFAFALYFRIQCCTCVKLSEARKGTVLPTHCLQPWCSSWSSSGWEGNVGPGDSPSRKTSWQKLLLLQNPFLKVAGRWSKDHSLGRLAYQCCLISPGTPRPLLLVWVQSSRMFKFLMLRKCLNIESSNLEIALGLTFTY